MDHDRVRELLSDYLEGNLPDEQAAEVRAAIEASAELKAETAALRETMSALSGLHQLDQAPDIAAKVEKKIHRRSRGRFFSEEPTWRKLPFEWISLVVIMLLLATYLYFVMKTDQPVSIRPGSVGSVGKPEPKAKTPRKGAAD